MLCALLGFTVYVLSFVVNVTAVYSAEQFSSPADYRSLFTIFFNLRGTRHAPMNVTIAKYVFFFQIRICCATTVLTKWQRVLIHFASAKYKLNFSSCSQRLCIHLQKLLASVVSIVPPLVPPKKKNLCKQFSSRRKSKMKSMMTYDLRLSLLLTE